MLDAIATKDTGTAALLLDKYRVPADGFIERCIVRAMGFKPGVPESEEPIAMLGDE